MALSGKRRTQQLQPSLTWQISETHENLGISAEHNRRRNL